MVGMLLRRSLLLWIAALTWLCLPPAATACPFCNGGGQTLTGEVNLASMVLYGTLANAKLGTDTSDGTTDLVIDTVIKKHDILGDKKTVTLSRYVPTDGDKKFKFLVFCDIFKGRIDPYRGIPVKADSDMAKYLAGALAVKDKDNAARLRFFFDYLDNPEVEVSNDAYGEFAKADYKDYKDMAHKLPADKVAKWLQDPSTSPIRFGLYASMLGHCGNEEHAKVLRAMLDDPDKRVTSGVDGILAGYTMLKPKDGWDYVHGLLKNTRKDFTTRYAALRSVRFLWEYRPDLVEKKELVAGVSQLLDDKNMADLAIEDLRKWQRWEVEEKVLGLYETPSHDIPIVRRSIVRYALTCPKEKSKAFVAELRKKDPQMVQDVEELLKLQTVTESTTSAQTPATTGKPLTK